MDSHKRGFEPCGMQEDLIKAIFSTSKQLRAFIARELKVFDIGFEQACLLFLLDKKENLSINEITALFEKDKATISRSIKTLESKQLVERFQEKQDKRSHIIRLTTQGRTRLKQVEEKRIGFMEKLESAITPEERRAFLSTLQKLLEAAE